jgi:hypothetical protein
MLRRRKLEKFPNLEPRLGMTMAKLGRAMLVRGPG